MIRPPRNLSTAVALSVLVMVGAASCSGSEGDTSATSTTVGTAPATTATTNAALGDLSDLDGATRGLSGGDLDCYDAQLALAALQTLPLGALSGSSQVEQEQLEADLATLTAQVPAAVADDIETYAAGVRAYSAALAGVDTADLTDPGTVQQIRRAGQALETPEVTAAVDRIQQYFATTCPAPTTTVSTPS